MSDSNKAEMQKISRGGGTNMGPVFLFVFDRLKIDHYLTSSSSIDGKFHALHHYIVEIGKKNEHKLYIKVKNVKIDIFEKGV